MYYLEKNHKLRVSNSNSSRRLLSQAPVSNIAPGYIQEEFAFLHISPLVAEIEFKQHCEHGDSLIE